MSPMVNSAEQGDVILPGGLSALDGQDMAALERAVAELEYSSLAMRLTAIVGRKVDLLGSLVPGQVSDVANKAAESAINTAMSLALRSLNGARLKDRRRLHRGVVVVAGAAGGAAGFSGLAIELPFTTTIMLRSIADIARGEGEDLKNPATALACLEVFALGGRAEPGAGRFGDDRVETGYFAVRGMLAKSVSEAARFLLERGIVEEAAPALVRFITLVGSRFGFMVSQKLAAQSIPIIGGVCGAGVNYAFVDHFQRLARGHFTIRRLERRYGARTVEAEYERITRAS
ncbi:EcsC family protein [Methylocapsa palsarum]|uniref:EcsC protein family protein n=1 Tax=Methylocapsa palsarum TaxID=1612308 RepID=A0A1I3XG52_9HYPH|nr:EcsC family protein [Methylocapsa palsarum]SFK18472.1 EcsC protein family protein [Methylocapsa palsarum]